MFVTAIHLGGVHETQCAERINTSVCANVYVFTLQCFCVRSRPALNRLTTDIRVLYGEYMTRKTDRIQINFHTPVF